MPIQPRLLKKPDIGKAAAEDLSSEQFPDKKFLQAQNLHKALVSKDWQLQLNNLLSCLSDETDFFVVGALGRTSTGKSSLLNALLGAREGGACSPFQVSTLEQCLVGQHCSRGIDFRISGEGVLALDLQPLFSLSLLGEVARWERPPLSLAGPAVAAASAIKSSVVPFEAALRLMELQMGVLMLSVCNLVVVMCSGLEDEATLQYLQTVEMLARGVQDPTLPLPTSTTLAGGPRVATNTAGGQQAQQRQQHLADVLMVHVVDPEEGGAWGGGGGVRWWEQEAFGGGGSEGGWRVPEIEARLQAFLGASRLDLVGPILAPGTLAKLATSSPPAATAAEQAAGIVVPHARGRLSYCVLPRAALGPKPAAAGGGSWGSGEGDRVGPAAVVGGGADRPVPHSHTHSPSGSAGKDGAAPGGIGEGVLGDDGAALGEGQDALQAMVLQLLRYPRGGFARRVGQSTWGAGFGAAWEAVVKSPDILEYYTRLVRTVYKGAGGWALAR